MKVACANAFLAKLGYMPDRLRGRRLFEWLLRPVQNDQPSALTRTSWRFKRRRYHEKHSRIIAIDLEIGQVEEIAKTVLKV